MLLLLSGCIDFQYSFKPKFVDNPLSLSNEFPLDRYLFSPALYYPYILVKNPFYTSASLATLVATVALAH